MVSFVPFAESHLGLFRSWLNKPHVKPFWTESESDEELREKFLTKLADRSVQCFIIEKSGRSIGYIQYYDAVRVGGGWWEEEKPGTFGVDLMIGEESELGKGEGSRILSRFVELIREREQGVTSVIIDPDPANSRAIRSFENAGFRREAEIKTPGGAALLMRIVFSGDDMKTEIQALEERIRQAQLANDARALDELIADELQFVVFDGTIAHKADDLASHRQKLVRFESIDFSDQAIQILGDIATVTVKAEIRATAGGQAVHGFYRYGRTWLKRGGRWQVVAGSVTQIP